jgi:hypothetical protein
MKRNSSQYMNQLCDALMLVFDRCATLPRRRLAGYAANLEFWIDEALHRLRLIDGFVERRRRMISGTQAVYFDDIRRAGPRERVRRAEELTTPNGKDVSADWEALEQYAQELRQRVVKSIKRFVRKCLATELITKEKLFEIEDRAGIYLRGR